MTCTLHHYLTTNFQATEPTYLNTTHFFDKFPTTCEVSGIVNQIKNFYFSPACHQQSKKPLIEILAFYSD